ncbi:MAG: elongation factor G, partial [Candidatus Krumholzibacteriia bacterium]
DQLREKLKHNAVMMQIPIGLEENLEGVVDLVTMRAFRFEGENGETIVESEIPESLKFDAEARREVMLDAVSMFSDDLMEAMLEETVTEEMIHTAVRNGVLSNDLTPVYMGSAYKNKGVQLLLDAVMKYLPAPTDVDNTAIRVLPNGEEEEFILTHSSEEPLVANAFKLEEGQYGQLTYVRVYQGTLLKGEDIYNSRTGKKVKVGRLGRMHSDEMQEIETAFAGDIVALFGVDCASGDTFTAGDRIALSSMHVPEPVVSLAIMPVDAKAATKLSKALHRFTREDPTFRATADEDTGDTIIHGMGELHLEVYIERMKREFDAVVTSGAPQVKYRETITKVVEFDYTHKKQTGGSGQYAKVVGTFGPSEDGDFHFESKVVGGRIPTEYISACRKGFQMSVPEGQYIGAPVQGLTVLLTDGNSHAVDSSDMAFQTACRAAFRTFYAKGKPVALEPLMLVSVEGPTEFQGDIIKTIAQRRGVIVGTTEDEGFVRVDANVPLAEMFGYATVLRSSTQGKAEFSMEFASYSPAPSEVAEGLVAEYQERRASGKK